MWCISVVALATLICVTNAWEDNVFVNKGNIYVGTSFRRMIPIYSDERLFCTQQFVMLQAFGGNLFEGEEFVKLLVSGRDFALLEEFNVAASILQAPMKKTPQDEFHSPFSVKGEKSEEIEAGEKAADTFWISTEKMAPLSQISVCLSDIAIFVYFNLKFIGSVPPPSPLRNNVLKLRHFVKKFYKIPQHNIFGTEWIMSEEIELNGSDIIIYQLFRYGGKKENSFLRKLVMESWKRLRKIMFCWTDKTGSQLLTHRNRERDIWEKLLHADRFTPHGIAWPLPYSRHSRECRSGHHKDTHRHRTSDGVTRDTAVSHRHRSAHPMVCPSNASSDTGMPSATSWGVSRSRHHSRRGRRGHRDDDDIISDTTISNSP